MDFHVSTPTETQLVMRTTEGGYVHQVWPAPASSLPGDERPEERRRPVAYLQIMSEMP
jgi:hypothetical protein